jgi:hypothetical protein
MSRPQSSARVLRQIQRCVFWLRYDAGMSLTDPDQALDRLWRALLADPEIAIPGWRGLALVGVLAQGSRSLSGYAYLEDGIWPSQSRRA